MDVLEAKNIHLHRGHPSDPVELVVTWRDDTFLILRLSEKQHEALTRDSHDLWFKKCVLA